MKWSKGTTASKQPDHYVFFQAESMVHWKQQVNYSNQLTIAPGENFSFCKMGTFYDSYYVITVNNNYLLLHGKAQLFLRYEFSNNERLSLMACCEVEHWEKQNTITTTKLWSHQLNWRLLNCVFQKSIQRSTCTVYQTTGTLWQV